MARQTRRQKLNSLYASLGLNLRDNDPDSPKMQAEAMRVIEAMSRRLSDEEKEPDSGDEEVLEVRQHAHRLVPEEVGGLT